VLDVRKVGPVHDRSTKREGKTSVRKAAQLERIQDYMGRAEERWRQMVVKKPSTLETYDRPKKAHALDGLRRHTPTQDESQ
jgi:hypothetical protein